MRRTLFAVLLAAALTACGGAGSGDNSDPAAACKNVFTTLCHKLFQCSPAEAAQVYGSESSCTSSLSGGCNATNTSCPNGQSYNAGTASQCINDYGAESCTDLDMGVVPTSCSHVCS